MRTLCLLVALTACNSDPIDRDIEGEVTITNGVYGQLTLAGDHIGNSPMVLENVHVTGFTSDSPPQVLMSTLTDEHGFYQIETGPGVFTLCTASATPAQGTSNPGPCTLATIDSGNVRRDWVQNLAGGDWCNAACTAADDNVD